MAVFNKEEFMRDLETLVNIDSGSNDIDGLNKVADFLCTKYESIGLSPIRKTQGPEQRPFLEIYTHPEADSVDLMLLGHMDTVFGKGTAKQRPFSTSPDGEWAYGPGVADMKAGDLLAFHLTLALRELYPQLKICVCHNSDEEIGSETSRADMQAVAAKSRYAFVLEPGRIGGHFVYQRKGAADIRIQCRGIASHAGNAPQDGASAILEMADIVQKMHALTDFETGLTVNAGVIRGGSASNVVAAECETIFDVRYTSFEQFAEFEAALNVICQTPSISRTTATYEIMSKMPPMKANEKTLALVQLLRTEATKLDLSPDFLSVGGASDGSFLAEAGCSVIDGCGPEGDGLHGDGEKMRIDSIEERFNLLLAAIKQLPIA